MPSIEPSPARLADILAASEHTPPDALALSPAELYYLASADSHALQSVARRFFTAIDDISAPPGKQEQPATTPTAAAQPEPSPPDPATTPTIDDQTTPPPPAPATV